MRDDKEDDINDFFNDYNEDLNNGNIKLFIDSFDINNINNPKLETFSIKPVYNKTSKITITDIKKSKSNKKGLF